MPHNTCKFGPGVEMVPGIVPEPIMELAKLLIKGLGLPQEFVEMVEKQVGFKEFQLIDAGDDVILDICEEMPTLAALLLMRDSLHRAGAALDNLDDRTVYLLPLLENIKNFLFGIAMISCMTRPGIIPRRFAASCEGRLKLVGEKLGL
ncbi:MAG: hypothetical protein FJ135_12200 [Deltaproteobacteria bacterium]|nr:hypothetical protein [Deltaproteobacteria bacterium]